MTSPKKTAAVKMTKDQASGSDAGGHLILNGKPSADSTVIVHEVVQVKAKDQADAIRRLKKEGYPNATVALETWKFPDPHTKDMHTAAVWVLQPPGEGSNTDGARRKARRKAKPRGAKRTSKA